jgi:hypothetical protein
MIAANESLHEAERDERDDRVREQPGEHAPAAEALGPHALSGAVAVPVLLGSLMRIPIGGLPVAPAADQHAPALCVGLAAAEELVRGDQAC